MTLLGALLINPIQLLRQTELLVSSKTSGSLTLLLTVLVKPLIYLSLSLKLTSKVSPIQSPYFRLFVVNINILLSLSFSSLSFSFSLSEVHPLFFGDIKSEKEHLFFLCLLLFYNLQSFLNTLIFQPKYLRFGKSDDML